MTKINGTSEPNIFVYTDFRLYLKDLVKHHKNSKTNFSMRQIAEKAGFGSPSFLKMIIDGARTLTDKTCPTLCDAFGLSGKQKDYFVALVHFNQSDNPDEKRKLLDALQDLRPRMAFSREATLQSRYLTHDYYACIREMVLLEDFKEDAKWIAARCLPRIKPQEARTAISDLLEMGFLTRSEDGKLKQADLILDTGQQTQVTEAFGYHEAVLNKARKYLSLLDQGSRDFSALTIPIDTKLQLEIKDRITKFQNELLDLINQPNQNYENVFQLNMQFFPVTQSKDDEDKS